MDIDVLIHQMQTQKDAVERAIADLEAVLHQFSSDRKPKLGRGRGRKSMALEERNVVSERMRNYWAGRRQKSVVQPQEELNSIFPMVTGNLSIDG